MDFSQFCYCYSLETAHLLGSAPYPGSPGISLSTTISSLAHSFSPLLGECLFVANYHCSKILTWLSPPSQKMPAGPSFLWERSMLKGPCWILSSEPFCYSEVHVFSAHWNTSVYLGLWFLMFQGKWEIVVLPKQTKLRRQLDYELCGISFIC